MMADFDRMDRMMSQFSGGAFGSMFPPSHSIMPRQQEPHQELIPFGNMFGNMNSMMVSVYVMFLMLPLVMFTLLEITMKNEGMKGGIFQLRFTVDYI